MAREFSTKRVAIDKANATLVLAVGIAAFLSVFALVASKALLDQRAYHSKVISKKEKALNTLKENIKAADVLTSSYQQFEGASTNVLGGNSTGDAERDGYNSRIVLDALPSKYDFPALTVSVDKLLKDNGLSVTSIEGTDDEIAQSGDKKDSKTKEIPFTVEFIAFTQQGKSSMELFERSIRPFKLSNMEIIVKNDKLNITLEAVTYYQPEKKVDVKTEIVK